MNANDRAYRAASKEKAKQILKEQGHDPEIRRHVEALLGSAGDTMSDLAVFGELFNLAKTSKTFGKVIATNV